MKATAPRYSPSPGNKPGHAFRRRMPTPRAGSSFNQNSDDESASNTVDLSIISDANMAWLLADAADVCLTGHERTMAFVELGCGEDHLAIERILNAVVSSRMALSVEIFDRLTRWLDAYANSPEEPHLRTMLAQIRPQQIEAAPMRAQPAQCDDVRQPTRLSVTR